MRVLEKISLKTGAKTVFFSARKDSNRLKNMARKETSQTKNRRKQLRAIKKGWLDQEQELEIAQSYSSGNF